MMNNEEQVERLDEMKCHLNNLEGRIADLVVPVTGLPSYLMDKVTCDLNKLEGHIEDMEAYLDVDDGKMDNIPAHCRPGLKRYIEHGIKPGKFLRAVLCNDLLAAVQYADSANLGALSYYGLFLLRHAPTACYGSKAKFDAWVANHDAVFKNEGLPPATEVCPTCNGSGEGRFSGAGCSYCGGSGEISVTPPQDDFDNHDYEQERTEP